LHPLSRQSILNVEVLHGLLTVGRILTRTKSLADFLLIISP
jgi:hypothetical protein